MKSATGGPPVTVSGRSSRRVAAAVLALACLAPTAGAWADPEAQLPPVLTNSAYGAWARGGDCPPWVGDFYFFATGKTKFVPSAPGYLLRGEWLVQGNDVTTEVTISSVGGEDSPVDHLALKGRVAGDVMQTTLTWETVSDSARHQADCTLNRTS
ncbi:MAG TPA: hypothetical protein VF459_00010 [Caulobacteraceae bacterium]